MIEQPRGEGEPKPESLEDQKYAAYRAAMEEEHKIVDETFKEIGAIAFNIPRGDEIARRDELQRIIQERKLFARMEEVMAKREKAYREWKRAMGEGQAAYEKEQEEEWETG